MPGTDPKRVGVFMIRNECASKKGRVSRCWEKKVADRGIEKTSRFR